MTVWADTMAETMVQPAPLQAVIDRSMTILAETMVQPAPLQTVIDRSMTVFRWILKNCH